MKLAYLLAGVFAYLSFVSFCFIKFHPLGLPHSGLGSSNIGKLDMSIVSQILPGMHSVKFARFKDEHGWQEGRAFSIVYGNNL